jgi:glycerol transport system ATP-binding protein
MHEGRILQTGPTDEVYRKPASITVAEIFSDPPINRIEAAVQDGSALLGEGLSTPLDGHLSGLEPGNYHFGVRSHHLFMERQHERDLELTCKVELAEINGSETFIHVDYHGRPLVIQEQGIRQHKIGSVIPIYVRPRKFYIFGEDGELVRAPILHAA